MGTYPLQWESEQKNFKDVKTNYLTTLTLNAIIFLDNCKKRVANWGKI